MQIIYNFYISFWDVQSGDHQSCEAYIDPWFHIDHRLFQHNFSRYFDLWHPAHIGFILFMLTVEDSRQRPPAVVFLKFFERCQRGFNDVPIVPLAQIGTSIYLTVFLCLCSYWHVWVHIVFIANLLSNAIFIFTVLLQRLTFTWALYCQCLPKTAAM